MTNERISRPAEGGRTFHRACTQAIIIALAAAAFLSPASPAPASTVESLCARIGAKLGSVTTEGCLERDLVPSGHFSVENTPIALKEYPPSPDRPPLGRILLLGGIHGDEYSSISIVFRWMEILDRHHSGMFHWKIVPLLNPDGLLRPTSRRGNARNVDLNRNFHPTEGTGDPLIYWQDRTGRDPRRFPGPKPLSEPETRFAAELIDSFAPDVIVAVHAPYGIVDFDGPPQAPNRLGHLHLHLLGTFPGSLGNYAGLHLGIPVITIELPHAGIMPSPREVGTIWSDLVGYLGTRLPARTEEASVRGDEPPLPFN